MVAFHLDGLPLETNFPTKITGFTTGVYENIFTCIRLSGKELIFFIRFIKSIVCIYELYTYSSAVIKQPKGRAGAVPNHFPKKG